MGSNDRPFSRSRAVLAAVVFAGLVCASAALAASPLSGRIYTGFLPSGGFQHGAFTFRVSANGGKVTKLNFGTLNAPCMVGSAPSTYKFSTDATIAHGRFSLSTGNFSNPTKLDEQTATLLVRFKAHGLLAGSIKEKCSIVGVASRPEIRTAKQTISGAALPADTTSCSNNIAGSQFIFATGVGCTLARQAISAGRLSPVSGHPGMELFSTPGWTCAPKNFENDNVKCTHSGHPSERFVFYSTSEP